MIGSINNASILSRISILFNIKIAVISYFIWLLNQWQLFRSCLLISYISLFGFILIVNQLVHFVSIGRLSLITLIRITVIHFVILIALCISIRLHVIQNQPIVLKLIKPSLGCVYKMLLHVCIIKI